MSHSYLEYHLEAVESCRRCGVDAVLARQLTFLKLPPFVGKDYRGILILGHSPKVRTASSIDTTLDLNMPRLLRRYIVNSVLEPLGIELEECAAVNIVRCLTRDMPEDIRVNGLNLMDAAFVHCKAHLVQEILTLKPRLLISLSERVSNLLQASFVSEQPVEPMKRIFGTLRVINVNGIRVNWIPVVHIPKPKVRAYYFPEQTKRLMALRNQVQDLL